jgi:uncharacterized membrane protein
MTTAADLGFKPMSGWEIAYTIIVMLTVMFIPGYLLSLAIFPKRSELKALERVVFSFALGLLPAFILMTLNIMFEVPVMFETDLIAALAVCLIGIAGYVYRGGNIEGFKEITLDIVYKP